jgi:hypothetical protein
MKNRSDKKPLLPIIQNRNSHDVLKSALLADEDYAWAWCHQLMEIQFKTMSDVGYTDCDGKERSSLQTAVNFMKTVFDIDITKNKHFSDLLQRDIKK